MPVVERNHKATFNEFPLNVRQRYRWAMRMLKKHAKAKTVLDAAAGVGHGSWLFAENGMSVDAVDVQEAKDWHDTYFAHDNVNFTVENLETIEVSKTYDAVVSMESIEHIKHDTRLIKQFEQAAPWLIMSVPNQTVVPFDPKRHIYHYRHYTDAQVKELLHNYDIVEWYKKENDGTVREGTGGKATYVVAKLK